MSRPLLVIFLTIFVNLVGFGIIIPLLPFYASTFGASPFVVGLLFASFSLAQLIAAPLLGELSDRWGRRPVLILSLIGTAVSFAMLAVAQSLAMLFFARIVDGLSGGNITTARAYIADITEEEDRAKAYGVLGAAFGLGFIVGPALGAAFSHISYTAPIWAAAAITVAAIVMAWVWLPETVHRAHAGGGAPWHAVRELSHRPGLRLLLAIDFIYWMSFAVYQTTFALFGAHRFGFDATHTGYLLSAFGALGVIVQGGLVGPIARSIGNRPTLVIGLPVHGSGVVRQRADLQHPGVRGDAGAGGVRYRAVQRDLDCPRQQRGVAARAGPRPGRGGCAREPGANARPGLGERRPAEDRRGSRLRRGRRPALDSCRYGREIQRAGPRTRERLKWLPGEPSPNCGELSFEASDELLHLPDHGADGVGLAQVDARLLQLLHRIVVAARPQQLEVACPGRGAL